MYSHAILFYYLVFLVYSLVLLGISSYSFIFLGTSLYSWGSLCTFAYHPVLLSASFVFPCIRWNCRCIPSCSLEARCIPRNLFVHSHVILFYSVLLLYFLVVLGISLYAFAFFGISLYSLESLCAFAQHSVLLSVPFVFPCVPWNLVVSLRIPWHLVVFFGISLNIRIPFCST